MVGKMRSVVNGAVFGKVAFTCLALCFAVFSLSLSPSYGGTIQENFDGNQYNHDYFWINQSTGTDLPTVSLVNNELKVTVPQTSSPELACAGLQTCFNLTGDFSVTVKFNLDTWSGDNVHAGIITPLFEVALANNFGGTSGKGYVFSLPGLSGDPLFVVPTSDTRGGLRVDRTGNTVEAFYFTTSGWQLIHAYSADPLQTDVSFYIGDYVGGATVGSAVVTTFDNLSITNRNAVPLPGTLLLLGSGLLGLGGLGWRRRQC